MLDKQCFLKLPSLSITRWNRAKNRKQCIYTKNLKKKLSEVKKLFPLLAYVICASSVNLYIVLDVAKH